MLDDVFAGLVAGCVVQALRVINTMKWFIPEELFSDDKN